MRSHVQEQSRLGGRSGSEHWARIDPIIYLTEARRQQARALGAALGTARRTLLRVLRGLSAQVRRRLLQPLAGRSERRRAITQLTLLDDRLLADIGLRRADIELAVDGHLADPRVSRRVPAGAPAVTERVLEGDRCPMPAATANANRLAASAQREQITDRAA